MTSNKNEASAITDECDNINSIAAKAFHRVSSFGNFAEPEIPYSFPTDSSQFEYSSESVFVRKPCVDNDNIELDLLSCIKHRKSIRSFGSNKLSMIELGELLVAGFGAIDGTGNRENEFQKHSAPSAGALFPLKALVLVKNVSGLDSGFYLFNSDNNSLKNVDNIIEPKNINDWFRTTHIDYSGTAVILFMIGNWGISCAKYGARGYRFLLIEAGHIAQNICLVSTGLSIPHVLIGGFDDNVVNDAFLLDINNEAVVYSMAIGCKF